MVGWHQVLRQEVGEGFIDVALRRKWDIVRRGREAAPRRIRWFGNLFVHAVVCLQRPQTADLERSDCLVEAGYELHATIETLGVQGGASSSCPQARKESSCSSRPLNRPRSRSMAQGAVLYWKARMLKCSRDPRSGYCPNWWAFVTE